MNIGIIGSGHVGRTLANHFMSIGHKVFIANSREPQSLVTFAEETGVIPATIKEVVHDKDIVVIAIPEGSIFNLPRDLFSGSGKRPIVVDAGNYYPEIRDIKIAAIDGGLTESGWVSQQLGIPIVKAFNNILAWSLETLALPPGTPGRICLSVAGDNSKDKKVLLELINQVGFDALDAGTLADSWRQQPGTPAYCMDLNVAELADALEQAEYSKILEYRMQAMADAKLMIEQAGSLAEAVAGQGKPANL